MTRLGLTAITLTLVAAPLAPVAAQSLLWGRQVGTSSDDRGMGVAVDGAGNVYVTGWTQGSLGVASLGGADAFLNKYDAAGTLLWTRQTGSNADDWNAAVAVDGAGNAYICGTTDGSFAAPNAGKEDIFLVKYDASGTRLWKQQIGTAENDEAMGVAVDSAGNVYITGTTLGSLGGPNAGSYDATLAKFDPSGTLLWTRQFGTPDIDYGRGVAVDGAGNAYIAGDTYSSLGGTSAGSVDAFLAKFDASGTPLWTRQIGTKKVDSGYGVAVDGAGHAYVAGYAEGSLGEPYLGMGDAFLAKYDASGALLWTRQIGTSANDVGTGVAIDGAGNAYIAGYTQGSFGGSNAGRTDLFVAKYDTSGTQLWARQAGTSMRDEAAGVAVDIAGNAYVAGYSQAGLFGPSAGGEDAFLAKFGIPACPADFNGDGFVTGDDFDAYSLVFISGDLAADFDGNGFVTGDDFDAYVAAFEAGC